MATPRNSMALLALAVSFMGGVSAAWDPSLYTTSPAVLPSPNATGVGWEEAFAKAQDFLAELTLEEKTTLITGTNGPCPGNIIGIERLNFTGLCLQDGPLAIRQATYASAFPAGVNAGASFDRKQFYKRGLYMGEEFRGKGAEIMLGPVAGPLGRTPWGGRNWEGFGADPYLSGIANAETVLGIQDAGVQATTKHFIGNEQETQRNPSTLDDGTTIESLSTNIDDRTMHELYVWPFADAVRAGTASIMCSYNRINGSYGCQNSKVLNGILKEELLFQGHVMSDWGAVHSGVATIEGGLDMNMPGGIGFSSPNPSFWGANATAAVQNGTIPESRIDDMVLRIMTPYFHLGQDKDFPLVDKSSADLNGKPESSFGFPFELGPVVDVRTEEHTQFIRESAANSTVLVKNTGSLPLKAPKNIAVFGNNAGDYVGGLYSLTGSFEAEAEEQGNIAAGGGSGTARFSYLVTPLEAIKARAKKDDALVQFILSNEAINNDGISSIQPQPEVCLVFIKSWATEGFDREELEPEHNGTGVVNTVAARCNNTIVVHNGAGPVLLPFASHPNVTAIVLSHFPGQESGNSLVDVLYGDVNPSGHLPYTIPSSISVAAPGLVNSTELATTTDPNAWQDPFTEGLFIDYRYYATKNGSVQYPFGFGLSYTTFSLADLKVSAVSGTSNSSSLPSSSAPILPGGNSDLWKPLYVANVSVSNTGDVAGAAVPQLYVNIADAGAPAGTPQWQLRGFDRVDLAPGETKTVGFELLRRDLSFWDVEAQQWRLPSGKIGVEVGFNFAERELKGSLA
ncbi:glycoside hydrolase superfamily [Phyllosticta citriasiana]|uniref:Probable beta-glucosidase G n=1 Tax=Phyllosticta citriasiana TaxID=595635 RepID=A0ABR1KUG6_9PEZI